MSGAGFRDPGPAARKPRVLGSAIAAIRPGEQRIPGAFQLALGLYIIFTGSFPTIIQAVAFGVQAGSGSEFVAAVVTGLVADILLLLPVLILANHPLGILHPLLMAVVVWPLLIHMPNVIEDWGGWTGVLSGLPVDAPLFMGIPNRSPSVLWLAIAKHNALLILGLLCTYAGFWLYRAKTNVARAAASVGNLPGVRAVMLALIALSFVVLAYFIRSRGGVSAHLTSLGHGRFAELSGDGAVMLLSDLGAIALYIWIAARPGEVKTPLFLAALAAEMAAQFISNGSRGGAIIIPLNVGLIWALRRRKIPWKIAAVLVPFMFVSIGLLGAIRTSSWYGETAGDAVAKTGWSQSVDLAEKEVEARKFATASVPVVERGYEVTDGPLYGSSYAVAITTFIPRPLWPDKPRGVGQYYARVFLGASFKGTSIPMSPEAEMYWNFGIPGVILLSMIYGALLRVIYNFLWRRYPDPFAIVFYFVFLESFQFSSDRIVGFEQECVLILLCYAAVSLLVPKANYIGEVPARRTSYPPSRVLSDQRS